MIITEAPVDVQEEACASPLDSGDGRDELLKRQAIYFNQKCVQLIKEKNKIEEEIQKASFTVTNLSKKQLKFYTGMNCLFLWLLFRVTKSFTNMMCCIQEITVFKPENVEIMSVATGMGRHPLQCCKI